MIGIARSGGLLLAALIGALLLLAAPASAAKKFEHGFADDRYSDNLFTSPDASVRSLWLGRAQKANASYARINVYWSLIANSKPVSATSPDDPAYDFAEIDRAVKSAEEEGLEVVLMVLNAPDFAESPGRPADLRPGTWMPDAAALGEFAEALARRYSGGFADPAGVTLPRVRYFEAWNEPNLRLYLNPLWNGKKPRAPEMYRDLLNSFYSGVKAASGSNKVITGGTSPFGDKRGGKRMRPLYFWRQVLCLNGKLKRTCNEQSNFDIFGHNAINSLGDGPTVAAKHKDDATPADVKDLKKIVKAAEKRGTAPGKKHPIWSTETWYESKPERKGLSLKGQARAMQEAMYVLWKQGASAVIFLQLRDSAYDPKIAALLSFQTGIYKVNGKPKPSRNAVTFPFVADRKKKGKKTILWGIVPSSGKVKIERKAGNKWRKVASTRAKPGKPFKLTKKIGGKQKLRAKLGSETSLTWNLR